MQITVTWITPREYSATIEERQLRDAVSRTSLEQEVSRLLDRMTGGQVLDDDAMLRLRRRARRPPVAAGRNRR
jgi:hypothetical protein